MRALIRRTAAVACAALVLGLPPAAAQASVRCTLESGTLAVVVTRPTVTVTLLRSVNEIEVHAAGEKRSCADPPPSVDSVSRVTYLNETGSARLVLDLSGGSFVDGVGDDIEFEVDMSARRGESDHVEVVGGAGADTIHLDEQGIDLNAGDVLNEGSDVRLLPGVEFVVVKGAGSGDVIDGSSGATQFPLPLVLFGGQGGDDLRGGSQGDFLFGGDGADLLIGGAGGDRLEGGNGPDELRGEEGRDRLVGGPGDDEEDGGPGDDVFDQGGEPDGSDLILGGDGDDIVSYVLRELAVTVSLDDLANDGSSGEGDDVASDIEAVVGGAGDDELEGGPGTQFLSGGPGDDELRGLGGDDELEGGSGDDLLMGGDGSDLASFADSPAPVVASIADGSADGHGSDMMSGVERIDGSQFADSLVGSGGDDLLRGLGGNDRILGGGGNDDLRGGPGQDVLQGGPGDDSIRGGAGRDTASYAGATASVRVDLRVGTAEGEGFDLLSTIEHVRGGPLGDALIGGRHADVLRGAGGDDMISGAGGADLLRGGPGDDLLVGGAGPDRIGGQSGNDDLRGGRGRDRLVGGPGFDRCVGGPGRDRVHGCEHGTRDRKDIQGGVRATTWASDADPESARGDGSVAALDAEAPNVLLVMTDDQRIGSMGVMKHTRRWLGERGTTFPNAIVTTPLCCPSRASVFTGKYVHNHGVRQNSDAPLLDHARTLQRYLRDAGYLTGISGKLMNKWHLPTNPPHFDRWAVMTDQGPRGYYDTSFNVNGKIRNRVKPYSTDFIGARARNFLRWFEKKDDAAPWLLYVTPWAPHGPFLPAKRHEDARVPKWQPRSPALLEDDLSDKHPIVQETASIGPRVKLRRKQLRTLMAVDELVEDLRQELRVLGETRDTLVIFMSDNGYSWGEHGWTKGKRLPFDEIVRVPFLARWPGHLPSGAVDERIIANIDIAPTVMEAAGLVSEDPMDGRPIPTSARDHILIEFWRGRENIPFWQSVWSPTEQYTEYHDGDGETSFREYYDLVGDPWQLDNALHDLDPDNDPSRVRLASLRAKLVRGESCVGTVGPAACP